LSTGRGIDKAKGSLHIVKEHREGQRDEEGDKKRLKVNEWAACAIERARNT
jgi:hypothetical protein